MCKSKIFANARLRYLILNELRTQYNVPLVMKK